MKFTITLCIAAVMMASCSDINNQSNSLSKEEKKEGFVSLFDGESMEGWHPYNKGKVASRWTVVNGELYCDPKSKQEPVDLVSDNSYENFDLRFDWKISAAGNSGVFINVVEKQGVPAAWASGPEYQLLESTHPDYVKGSSKMPGCIFGFTRQENPAELKPLGEWNESRITQQNGKIEFFLNGVLTTQQDFTSQSWQDSVSKTWFKEWPEFGKHTQGHIALQDWAKGISFRNIRIKVL